MLLKSPTESMDFPSQLSSASRESGAAPTGERLAPSLFAFLGHPSPCLKISQFRCRGKMERWVIPAGFAYQKNQKK